MTVVIGLGQSLAGDDGVGWAVIEELERHSPVGVDVVRVREASALLSLLDATRRKVILVDAILGAGPPGTVQVLSGQALDDLPPSRLSSHGVGVKQALALARRLDDGVASEVAFVTVSIASAERGRQGLSPDVAAAVPEAASRVRELLHGEPSEDG